MLLTERTEREVLAVAAALESRSQHPLAQAILERARGDGIAVSPAVDFQSVTGAGARGVVDGVELFIGSPQLFAGLGLSLSPLMTRIEALQREGKTVVALGSPGEVHGLIAIMDPLRPDAAHAIAELKRAGIERSPGLPRFRAASRSACCWARMRRADQGRRAPGESRCAHGHRFRQDRQRRRERN